MRIFDFQSDLLKQFGPVMASNFYTETEILWVNCDQWHSCVLNHFC